MPDLKDLLSRTGSAPSRAKTPEQLLAMVRYLNSMTGGSVNDKAKATQHGR